MIAVERTFSSVPSKPLTLPYAQLHGVRLSCSTSRMMNFSAFLKPCGVLECCDAARKRNGLGFSSEQAARYVDLFQTLVRVLPESPEIFPTWRKIVLENRVSGIQVHDARIVAAMTVHQVSRILTFDLDDFKRYNHITVVHPNAV